MASVLLFLAVTAGTVLTCCNALVCSNLTLISSQDQRVVVQFQKTSEEVFILQTLPEMGDLYEQVYMQSKGLLQGTKVASVPYTVNAYNALYYRPYPKQASADGPLSTFYYRSFILPSSGPAQVSDPCWVKVVVQASNNLPFSGGAGQCLKFDGADDHVYTPIQDFPESAITVSMWIKTLGARKEGEVPLSFISFAGIEFEIRDLNDVRVVRGNNVTQGAGFSVNDGKWHQLGVTWNISGTVQLFIDGRLVHRTTLPVGPPIAFSGDLILGQSGSVNYTSARQLWRASAQSASTFSAYSSSYEQLLIVNRMEALEEIVTSSGEYRQRQPTFLQGIPKGCSCRGGAFDHTRSFEGLMDELRIYKSVRSEIEMQLDSHTVLSYPSILSVSNLSLWLYYTMDDVDRWSSQVPNDFNRIMTSALLGGGSQAASPMRIPSDAPLVGAKVEDVVVPLGSWQLIDLKMMDFETNKSKLYARVETLPTLGNLWQSDDSENPSTIIDRGDGRTKPLILSPKMQVWYEPVDLGQPNVMRWNDQGELVKIDTRADTFMIRISDVQFIPEAMIDPDNPPPWITTQYVVRPMTLPIPVNQSISIQQGIVAPVQLSWIDYERKDLDFLFLSMLEFPSYFLTWGACTDPLACCSSNCAATNLCINCTDTCRRQELEDALKYSSSANCSLGSVSTIPSRLATAIGDTGTTCASLPLNSDVFYSLPGPPVCSFKGPPLSDGLQDELFLVKVQSQAAFVPFTSNFSFKIERPGRAKSSDHFNVSSFSRSAFVSVQGTPINRAPFPSQLGMEPGGGEDRTMTISYSSSDPDGDALFFRISAFPRGGKVFNPSKRNSSRMGGLVEEVAGLERSIPLTQTYMLGTAAVPQGARVIRRRNRDPTLSLEEQCGTSGVEGLEIRLQRVTYVSELELHALLPLSSPIRLFVRSEDVDWDVIHDLRHKDRTSVLYSRGSSSPPTRFDLTASHERQREMEETWSVVPNSSEWVQVWVGVAEEVMQLPEVFRILLPPLELPATSLRLVTCGAWSLSAVGEVPSYLRASSQVFVSGFHGSIPQQLRGGKVFYVPEENFQGGEGLSIIVSDGQLDAESSSSSSFPIPPYVRQVKLPDLVVDVEEGGRVSVDLRGLAAQLNSSSLLLLQSTRVGVLTGSAGDQLTANTLLLDPQLFFFSSYGLAAGPNVDSFRYRFTDTQQDRFLDGLVLFNVFCQPGRMIPLGGSVCRDCERGTYQVGSGLQAVCVSCPQGTFQPSAKSASCAPCPPGMFSSRLSSSSCSPCPPGTFSDQPGAWRCKECGYGRMMPVDRATSCFSCGSVSFNQAQGRTSCSSCPVRTKTMSLTAANATDCQCTIGSFNVGGCTGQPCLPCPRGMFCGGGRNAPLSRAGFWSDTKLWINGTAADITECNYRALRDNCAGLERYADSDLGYRTLPGLMQGGDCRLASRNYSHVMMDNSQCKEGYQGRFCTACADGAFRSFDESCEICTGEPAALFFFAVIFVFTVFAQLVKLFIKRRTEHLLVLEWGQCFNMLTYFAWPMPAVTKFLASSLSLFNLNFNFLPWACYGLQLSSVAQRCLLAPLPPMLVTLLLFSFEIQRRWVLRKLQQGAELEGIWPISWHSIMLISASRDARATYKEGEEVEETANEGGALGSEKPAGSKEHDKTGTGGQRKDLNVTYTKWRSSVSGQHLRLGLVLYDMLLVVSLANSLQLFRCRKLTDQRSSLEAIPDVQCWTPQHVGLLAIGSLTALCHAVLFPSFIMRSLSYSFLEAELQDPDVLLRFSDFYLAYEDKYWWWYFTVLLRRIGYVSAAVFLTSYGYLQVTVALVISAISMFASNYFRPFKDNRYNILESCLHAVTALCILTSSATSMQMSTARSVDHSQQGPVLLVVASLSSAAFIAVSFSHNNQLFVLPQEVYSLSNKIKELAMKRLDPRFIAVVIVMVRWISRLRQRVQASALFTYHEFPFESGHVVMGEEMPRERREALGAENQIKGEKGLMGDQPQSQPLEHESSIPTEQDLKLFKPIRSAWETDGEQKSSFQALRAEEKDLLADILHHRGLHSLHPHAHLLERRVNVKLKQQVASLNDSFHDLFAQAYDASGRVEVTLNYLNSLKMKILNAQVDIRAERQKNEYMRRRLAVEDELIPNEPILAMEQENLAMRAAAMTAEKEACQKEIQKLAKAIEEELEDSSSDSD